MLGDRGVAVTLDDVNLDAAAFQLADIHVARWSGAEKDDVLEFGALRHQRRRHVGVIVDRDLVALDDARQLFARKGCHVDVDRRIVLAVDALPHWRQLFVAVEEDGFHGGTGNGMARERAGWCFPVWYAAFAASSGQAGLTRRDTSGVDAAVCGE